MKYISFFRLRSIVLFFAGISLGSMIAYADGYFYLSRFVLALLTSLFLQIQSNVANDLGDFRKGTDNQDRLGPKSSLMKGEISEQTCMRFLYVFTALSIISGITLIYISFDDIFNKDALIMLTLGALSIIAAIKYTFGKGAYGYRGLGDIFVFLFFGLLSIVGVYFLMTGNISYDVFLPAASCGLLSTGVLNVNNMRDIENDKNSNKITIAVKLGVKNSRIYHTLLLLTAFVFMTIFMLDRQANVYFLASLPLFIIHLRIIYRGITKNYTQQLKLLSIFTLIFCILAGLGLNL